MKRSHLARKTPLRRSRMKRKAPRRVTRPGPGGDPGYLAKVRTMECVAPRRAINAEDTACWGPMQAHHAGRKDRDTTAVPLCLRHHDHWHGAYGVFRYWNRDARRIWAEVTIESTRRLVRAETQDETRGERP